MSQRHRIGIIGAGAIGLNMAGILGVAGYDVAIYNRRRGAKPGEVDTHWLDKEGRVDDLNDSLELPDYGKITLTSDLDDLVDCYAIIVTAGATRKEGETRQDLARKNAAIMDEYAALAVKSPQSLMMVISNPVDGLTQYVIEAAAHISGRPVEEVARKVIGVSAVDTMRLKHFVRQFIREHHPERENNVIEALVLGEHGPSMVPVFSTVTVDGTPLTELATPEQLEEIRKKVTTRGAEIIKRTGTSAFVGPARAAVYMIQAIDGGQGIDLPCSVWDGKRCIGGVATFTDNTVVQTVSLALTVQEQNDLATSQASLDAQYLEIRNASSVF